MSSDSESNDDLLRFSDLEENSDGAGEEDVGIGGGRPSLGLDRGEDEDDQGEESKGQKGLRHLKEISSVLGLDKFKEKSARRRERKRRAKARKKAAANAASTAETSSSSAAPTEDRMVETEASRWLGSAGKVEVVTHKDKKKRKRKLDEGTEVAPTNQEEMTMKQSRFDVYKFGVAGLGREEREDAEAAMLVRLGAKPEKAKGVEYPEFKEARRKQKELERERKELERISGVRNSARAGGGAGASGKQKKNNKAGKNKAAPSSAKKAKKKGGGGGDLQTKLGKFDGGMLRLSAKDLMSIKKKKK